MWERCRLGGREGGCSMVEVNAEKVWEEMKRGRLE